MAVAAELFVERGVGYQRAHGGSGDEPSGTPPGYGRGLIGEGGGHVGGEIVPGVPVQEFGDPGGVEVGHACADDIDGRTRVDETARLAEVFAGAGSDVGCDGRADRGGLFGSGAAPVTNSTARSAPVTAKQRPGVGCSSCRSCSRLAT